MDKITKKERNFQILTHIISNYVSSAAPVSSKSVTQSMQNKVSSATVRNVMADLEDNGYIKQPHTSAGRIPTDKGYRFYVDSVRQRLEVEKVEAERLAREYTDRARSIKDIIERTSFIISRELKHAGIVMWPSVGDFYLKHLELVKIKSETVMAVLVTMTNAVKNYVIRISRDLEKTELEKVANFINSNYEEENISRIAASIKDVLREDEGEKITEVAGLALETIDHIIQKDIENDIYWEGLDYFTEEPEFRHLDLSRNILQMFSNRKAISRLMRNELPYRGLRVYIGTENEYQMFSECSVITSGYGLFGNTIGRIGVIGPTRMDYCSALRTVNYLSDLISSKLEELSGQKIASLRTRHEEKS